MKTSTSKLQLNLGADNYCADFAGASTYKDRVRAAARFCAERHLIYLRRASGMPKPWTNDPILRSYRFCNIYRELDTVTEWIMGNWISKDAEDLPNLAARALVGRLINFPRTLEAMLNAGFDFQRKPNHERLFALFQKLKEGGHQLVTGAYIVNTIIPKGVDRIDGSKADYIANVFVPEVWEHRKELDAAMNSGSFAETIAAMRKVRGVGAFIGNQAAVDLSYTKHLRNAKDLHSTWNPGPGTIKGIRWITDDWSLHPNRPNTDEALTRYRNDVNEVLAKHPMWSDNMRDFKTHIVPLSGPNASNSLCELSKEVWMALGWRDRMKNSYKGN